MKIHVKNINVEHQKLFELLCDLQKPFISNKDTHTFYNCDDLLEKQLNTIKEHFEQTEKTILIIKGGL